MLVPSPPSHRQPSVTESAARSRPNAGKRHAASFVFPPAHQSFKLIAYDVCSEMMLVRISPGPIGFEHRLFECPTCDRMQNEIVASDRMNPPGGLLRYSGPELRGRHMLDAQNQGPQCTACGSP